METKKNPLKEWLSKIVGLLTKLSKKSKPDNESLQNDDYASLGTTDESKQLIKELCNEIDVVYECRRELKNVEDMDAWLETKSKKTLDDLANEGLIDKPTDEDYKKMNESVKQSIENSLGKMAESVAENIDNTNNGKEEN